MTEKNPNNNIISLRHHLETLMHESKEAHAREHELLAQSVAHASKSLEIRLETMNEFRTQILSERGAFITKDKFDLLHEVLERRVSSVESALSNLRGRMTAIAAAIGVGLVVLELILRFVVK